MKVFEILNEVIDMEAQRKHFGDTIDARKEELQKKKTVLGVTRLLRKMFPGVKFKFLGDRRGASATFNRLSNEVVVYNTNRLMSAPRVQKEWNLFRDTMVGLLTHEHLHKEQNARSGGKDLDAIMLKKKAMGSQVKKTLKLAKEMTELHNLHAEAKSRRALDIMDETQDKIDKLIVKSAKQGIHLSGTYKNYLGLKHEITAYAEQIANDLVSMGKVMTDGGKMDVRQYAMHELKTNENLDSWELLDYQSKFAKDEKPMKRMYKQIVKYIEMKTV